MCIKRDPSQKFDISGLAQDAAPICPSPCVEPVDGEGRVGITALMERNESYSGHDVQTIVADIESLRLKLRELTRNLFTAQGQSAATKGDVEQTADLLTPKRDYSGIGLKGSRLSKPDLPYEVPLSQ